MRQDRWRVRAPEVRRSRRRRPEAQLLRRVERVQPCRSAGELYAFWGHAAATMAPAATDGTVVGGLVRAGDNTGAGPVGNLVHVRAVEAHADLRRLRADRQRRRTPRYNVQHQPDQPVGDDRRRPAKQPAWLWWSASFTSSKKQADVTGTYRLHDSGRPRAPVFCRYHRRMAAPCAMLDRSRSSASTGRCARSTGLAQSRAADARCARCRSRR